MARGDNAPIRRTLAMVLILSRLRHGMDIGQLSEAVSDRTGIKWSKRTLRRDLSFLEEEGLVERVTSRKERGWLAPSRWYWRGVGQTAKAFEE